MLNPLLHVGSYNYVLSNQIVGIFDLKMASIKRLIKSVKEEKPRNLIDISGSSAAASLLVLTGDRYILSPIGRQTLANRLFREDDTTK